MNLSTYPGTYPGTSPARSSRRPRLLEAPWGKAGPGRMVERWLCLWRWETWASQAVLARRPRAGWTLTFRAALRTSQDALDDYELATQDA
jgi:hypothetical protein